LAGFEVTLYGRFWVTPEGGSTYLCGYPAAPSPSARAENALCIPLLNREMEIFALAELHM